MRVTVGAIAVLGLAVTVAAAQPPVRERAAALKAPEVLPPNEVPVARGAIDDYPPPILPSTLVTRAPKAPPTAVPPSAGPAWLTGVDPNVLPAAGLGSRSANVSTLTPPPLPKDAGVPAPPPKFLDRLKGTSSTDKQPAPQPAARPGAQPQPAEPTASTPFRGTGANGAPVFAGPPAYRWYGWGSVTPGANPLAPTGQYPKASANWYSITGATPGAFPVPVSNPGRVQPGTEPPSYGLARTQPPVHPAGVATGPVLPPPTIKYTEHPEAPKPAAPVDLKPAPGPISAAMPGPAPSFLPPPTPVGVPTITPPPLPRPSVVPPAPPSVAVKEPAVPVPPTLPPIPKPESVAVLPPPPVLPPALPPLPAMSPVPSVEPVKPVLPPVAPSVESALPTVEPKPVPTVDPRTAPKALPTSVTTEELKWQESKDPVTPPPGTWAPASGAAPLPTVTPSAAPAGPVGLAPGAPAPAVARGQMPDRTPDPVATLIKQLCQGRADGVEVRWTGTKKLSVCFEARTAPAAQQLVNDISKRQELTAYQIDFCVLVK